MFDSTETRIRFKTPWTSKYMDKNRCRKNVPRSMRRANFMRCLSLTCAPRSKHTKWKYSFVLACSWAEWALFSQHHFTAFIQFDADYCICYMLWVFVIWYGISFDLSQLINKIYWISMKRWKWFFFFTHLADSSRGYLIGKKRLQRSDKFWEKKRRFFHIKWFLIKIQCGNLVFHGSFASILYFHN